MKPLFTEEQYEQAKFKDKLPVECLNCKEEFHTTKRILYAARKGTRTGGQYCSKQCAGQALTKRRTKTIQCATCKTPFERQNHQINQSISGSCFCSLSCAAKHNSQNQPLKSYRKIAFRHHPNKCSRCGYDKLIDVLEVHHIDRDHSNNSLENLEILCPTCHAEEHYLARDGRWSSKNNKFR